MATTIINPTPGVSNASNDSWVGLLLGGIVITVFVILFVVYAVPMIRGLSGNGKGIQVNLPKSVNVNVQQAK